MGRFTFIIGGSRSGKSRYAQELARGQGKKIAFIATCVPRDSEMKKRVALHKKSRPKSWKVFEEPGNIRYALGRLQGKYDTVIVDCLGLFISNLLSKNLSDSRIKKEIKSTSEALSKAGFDTIVVSNAVGEGLVPLNPVGRRFVDLVGLANQAMAGSADTVYHMQAGIPVKIK